MPRWIARLRPRTLVELGAGSSAKTRTILDAMRAEGSAELFVPVDISGEFLERAAAALREEYPGLRIEPVAADFTRRVTLPPDRPPPALITILGSTIGNFTTPEAVALLARVRTVMEGEDRFLLGVDLEKDAAVLEAAYNDAQGVTAEFNLNLLRVLNREYGADFDLPAYRHRAHYDPADRRIEMHLVALRPQQVRIPGVGTIQLAEGESIRTEISCKYDRAGVEEMFSAAGLALDEWVEDDKGYFGMALGRV